MTKGKRAHGEGTITKRDDGRWEARASVGYTPEGKPKRRSVYGRTQAEVREKLDKLKGQLAAGTYSDAKLSVADYLGQWLKDKRHDLKPATFEAYRICVEQFITPMVGRVRLDKLNPCRSRGSSTTSARPRAPPLRAAPQERHAPTSVGRCCTTPSKRP